ncbi:ATP-dependent nuclease [Chryseobacterium sp. JM1]|uniref:ATP-dependent nuclease n=1 Tax=Chryseobacterium sp. JM1 TaxID=1233950 RepID=UPI0004E7A133|nr:AAA family ATPase [Chryseobacterium sp. JM1]KFF21486.1 ATP-dependent endonuclease [Chryseobacterium sp. JM1]
MKIDFVKIKNFRKLQNCKIEFSDEETILVGANNSGKTTAIEALMAFLKEKKFEIQDFTITNWNVLNKLAEVWITKSNLAEEDKSLNLLDPYLPALDLWINVNISELRYISHLIPTLDWTGGLLGIRLILQPKNMETLVEEYTIARQRIIKLKADSGKSIDLWPKNFWQFCERRLDSYFEIKTYILDPERPNDEQIITENNFELDGNPLKGLIKVDVINAQRGFGDPKSPEYQNTPTLSSQLRSYYEKHLNPNINPTENDLNALESLNDAQKIFDSNLQTNFKKAIDELHDLNYPGFGNPEITLSSLIKATDGLNHESAVIYNIDKALSLPEKYNGLGYQNLISMAFKLISYRDEWMKKGKKADENNDIIEPLHLVLIEEPEAHLHAQVQQVFIKEAYKILRKHDELGKKNEFTTQVVISTHSSYIAHQKFESLRYFKRNIASIPISEVLSIKSVFDSAKPKEKETEKFVIRYLNTTHNDLFFADAAILVEGPAERILLPHFIKNNHVTLDKCYITILEIGGSHAHRLKPLIEKLGLTTLIITDLDSKEKYSDISKIPPKNSYKKCMPQKGADQITDNETLKSWNPKIKEIDNLLELTFENKLLADYPIRIAYQTEIDISGTKVYPYTFEDALVLENIETFKTITETTGLLKKMVKAANEGDPNASAQQAYLAINGEGVKKAEFALDVLYFEDPTSLKTPTYIREGLNWLQSILEIEKKIETETSTL